MHLVHTVLSTVHSINLCSKYIHIDECVCVCVCVCVWSGGCVHVVMCVCVSVCGVVGVSML